MNPLRYIDGSWSPWLIGLVIACIGIVVWNAFLRRRERRGDWGPGPAPASPSPEGYSPVDLRGPGARGRGVSRSQSPEDEWMRGLAAPFVENAGLLHERWSLVPAFCDAAWRRRLGAVIDQWGASRAPAWRRAVADAEARAAAASDQSDPVAAQTLAVARLAMLLRLGVAARHTTGAAARRRLRSAGAGLTTATGDWLAFGDAFLRAYAAVGPRATEMRADVRGLYAADGPWHDPAWPAPVMGPISR